MGAQISIPGNEKADQLAQEGALMEPSPDSSSSSSGSEQEPENPVEQVIVEGPPRLADSDGESETETAEEQAAAREPTNKEGSTNKKEELRIDLERSIRQFEESFINRGIDPSELTNHTLAWDHEGLDETP